LGRFDVGLVLVTRHWGADRTLPRWADVRDMALHAEALGFDTVWLEDELLFEALDACAPVLELLRAG